MEEVIVVNLVNWLIHIKKKTAGKQQHNIKTHHFNAIKEKKGEPLLFAFVSLLLILT